MIEAKKANNDAGQIHVQIDRVQLLSWAPEGRTPPTLTRFVVTRDSFVRCQTTTATYARCRHYKSLRDDTKIYWQYRRQKGWLEPWKITIVADDKTGLAYEDFDRVTRRCRLYHFLTVELAIDFSPSMGISRGFIPQHATFGKSRPRAKHSLDRVLYRGRRRSNKLVRCYAKDELNVFRVELELHSRLLRHHSISALADLQRLPGVIYPKHLLLVGFDWERLEHYLAKRFGMQASRVLAGARKREASVRRTRRYLARQGVVNIHRFLVPLAINDAVVDALDRWARTFRTKSND